MAHPAEAQAGERFVRAAAVFAPGPAQPANRPVAAHEDHVPRGHREVPVDVFSLGDEGDSGGSAPDVLAGQPDAAGRGREDAGDGFQERALAATVRADEADNDTRRDDRIDLVSAVFSP